MERHCSHRKTDGSCSGPNIDPNAVKWNQRIRGPYAYRLTVSYFGLPYYGWQKAESGPTIQEELEKALYKILQTPISCEAASRTDRGVHAVGQIVQFYTDKQIKPPLLQKALNGVLPQTIRITEAEEISVAFHPTLDAQTKTYHYYICYGSIQDPFHRHISWHYPYPLDFLKMNQAAQTLIGTQDFSRFSTQVKENPICTLSKIELIPLKENRLQITFTGDRFLYKMVRRLSGTLAGIGAGKIALNEVGVTAPPHGLFLYKINYTAD